MKKNLRVPVLAAALAGAMVLGAGATTVAERVSADLRPDITVTVDGKDQTLLDKNGDVVYPITYAGTTYLPIRALGNVMDLDVEWNGKTQTISLYTRTDTKPEDLTLEKLTVRAEEAEQAATSMISTAIPSKTFGRTSTSLPSSSTGSTGTARWKRRISTSSPPRSTSWTTV